MFDTMTITKTVGGLCGALLIFLLGNWAAEALYSTEGGHGEGDQQGYIVATGETAPAADAGPAVPFSEILAAADVAKGEKVFAKCKACHKIDGTNATGPHLDGVANRAIDSVSGYEYSGALLQVGDVWTPENLNHFLTNPRDAAPGTKMTFIGLPKEKDRANVIAYLETLGG